MSVEIVLQRTESSDKGTFGILLKGSEQIGVTAERPWLMNKEGVSCIPKGVYQCVKYSSYKHPAVWEIRNVPDRSFILIHNGNFPLTDSQGCILIGEKQAGDMILLSDAELDKLRSVLPDSFVLTITGV